MNYYQSNSDIPITFLEERQPAKFEILLPATSPSGLSIPDSERSKGYFLFFSKILSYSTILCLLFTTMLQIFCYFSGLSSDSDTSHSNQLFYDSLYRGGGFLLTVVAFLCEMEWTETVRSTALLQYWTTRGIFYVFIALFTFHEYQSEDPLIRSSIWYTVHTLICLGILYSIMVCR